MNHLNMRAFPRPAVPNQYIRAFMPRAIVTDTMIGCNMRVDMDKKLIALRSEPEVRKGLGDKVFDAMKDHGIFLPSGSDSGNLAEQTAGSMSLPSLSEFLSSQDNMENLLAMGMQTRKGGYTRGLFEKCLGRKDAPLDDPVVNEDWFMPSTTEFLAAIVGRSAIPTPGNFYVPPAFNKNENEILSMMANERIMAFYQETQDIELTTFDLNCIALAIEGLFNESTTDPLLLSLQLESSCKELMGADTLRMIGPDRMIKLYFDILFHPLWQSKLPRKDAEIFWSRVEYPELVEALCRGGIAWEEKLIPPDLFKGLHNYDREPLPWTTDKPNGN